MTNKHCRAVLINPKEKECYHGERSILITVAEFWLVIDNDLIILISDQLHRRDNFTTKDGAAIPCDGTKTETESAPLLSNCKRTLSQEFFRLDLVHDLPFLEGDLRRLLSWLRKPLSHLCTCNWCNYCGISVKKLKIGIDFARQGCKFLKTFNSR
jgi:hypothetical protein